MTAVGILVIILNFFDAVFTTAGLSQGVVVELNPMLRELYAISPLGTFIAKVVLIPLGVIFALRAGAGTRLTRVGLIICLFVYLWAFGLHFIWLNRVLFC